MPTITTIIPTYRRPALLARAIHSVLAQNYPQFEVHIYDNASGDETRTIVADFAARDRRVNYHCHARNIGMMENFAFAISHIETPLFNILSDDDFLLPGFFERATSALKESPDAGLFFGGLLYANPEGRVVAAPVEETWKVQGVLLPPALFGILAPGAWVTWTSILFKSSLLPILGGFDAAIGHTADVDLILRATLRVPVIVSQEPCAVLTVHPGSASERDRSQVLEDHLRLNLFARIDRAIYQAGEDRIFPHEVASVLRSTYVSRVCRDFFRRGLLAALQGDPVLARRTADVLKHKLHHRGFAALIRLSASQNLIGWLLRLVLRGTRHARRRHFDFKGKPVHARNSSLVEECLSRLPSAQSMSL